MRPLKGGLKTILQGEVTIVWGILAITPEDDLGRVQIRRFV